MQITDQQKEKVTMKRIIIAVALFIILASYLYGQNWKYQAGSWDAANPPLSTILASGSVPLILVAPNIYAVADETKYQPAYDACMAGPGTSVWLCQVTANQAVTADAQQRFILAFVTMANRLGPTAHRIFTQYQLVYQAQ